MNFNEKPVVLQTLSLPIKFCTSTRLTYREEPVLAAQHCQQSKTRRKYQIQRQFIS